MGRGRGREKAPGGRKARRLDGSGEGDAVAISVDNSTPVNAGDCIGLETSRGSVLKLERRLNTQEKIRVAAEYFTYSKVALSGEG